MRLRDMFDADEIPTRPDLPNTAARRCRHCWQVYGDHTDIFPSRPDAACYGVKCNYEPEEHGDGDGER